jgi:hypothetical protein
VPDAPAINTSRSGRTVSRRKRKAKAAVIGVGNNRRLVKVGGVLFDGRDRYVVNDEAVKHGTKWFELYNEELPEGERHWFSVEDMGELAVLIGQTGVVLR